MLQILALRLGSSKSDLHYAPDFTNFMISVEGGGGGTHGGGQTMPRLQ